MNADPMEIELDTARHGRGTTATVRVSLSPITRLRKEWPAIDWGAVLVHLLLVGTVLIIGFPLYYAFVISTQSLEEVISRPPNLLPSGHL